MQPVSEYKQNDKMRLLLQGPPGSGKTTLACQFPKPAVIDIDVNLGGTLRWMAERKMTLPVGFARVDRRADGSQMLTLDGRQDFSARYTRLDEVIQELAKDDNVETIILDSATMLVDLLISETLRKQQKSVMTKQEWGFFFTYGKHLMSVLTSLNKHIVLTAHEKINKNVDGSIAYPIKINWPGQLGQIIGAFFTNVWRCEVKQEGFGAGQKHKWTVRTMPDFQFELKNTLGLPAEFEFKWDMVAAKLKGGAA